MVGSVTTSQTDYSFVDGFRRWVKSFDPSLYGKNRSVYYTPHPGKEVKRWVVEKLRNFLETTGG